VKSVNSALQMASASSPKRIRAQVSGNIRVTRKKSNEADLLGGRMKSGRERRVYLGFEKKASSR
jgi:hypothetical protein